MKMSDPNNLYFDIETTGLSPDSSHLTVIGTAFWDGRQPVIRQFVCERPTDERSILRDFSDFAAGFRKITHFNGKSFDIPYVRKKFSFFRIEDPFFDIEQEDLYLRARKFAPLFQMNHLKQKDFESASGFSRTDTLSGAECVSAYREYLRTGQRSCLDRILLHNREDLLGMLHISRYLAGFTCLTDGKFQITGISDEPEDSGVLTFRLAFESPFLSAFELKNVPEDEKSGIPFSFSADGQTGFFTLHGTTRELKFFFDNYKDYYFLPLENRAVHKSVGQFVDAAYREKATRSTAYEPVTALFYPQPFPIIRPAFQSDAADKIFYFRAEDIKDPDELKDLIVQSFCAALK